jgi:hypothetical protein
MLDRGKLNSGELQDYARRIQSVEAYFLESGEFAAPKSLRLQYRSGDDWVDVPGQMASPKTSDRQWAQSDYIPNHRDRWPAVAPACKLSMNARPYGPARSIRRYPLKRLSLCCQTAFRFLFGVTAYTVAGYPN